MSYFSLVAPWAVILIYFLSFAFVAFAMQALDFSKIIKPENNTMGIIIFLVFSIAIAFLVGSFITMIIGASTAAVNGGIYV
ncbi:MAG: DUF1146 domain-containing protein [Mycoplasmataceae bacterium]|nr:DUF1146 domain-containing protein [Mycoplasmataceae bacterium]